MNSDISLTVSEIGEQIQCTSSINKQLTIILKQIGIPKSDIVLLDADSHSIPVEALPDLRSLGTGNTIYLFSKSEKISLYQNFFNDRCSIGKKNSLNYISSSELLSTNKNKPILHQELYNKINLVYDSYKEIQSDLLSQIKCLTKLISGVDIIDKSMSVLVKYYNDIKNETAKNFNILNEVFKSTTSKVASLENKYKNFVSYKNGLNDFDEMSLFSKLFNEIKIKSERDQQVKKLNYIKDKFEKKAKAYATLNSKWATSSTSVISSQPVLYDKTYNTLKRRLNKIVGTSTKYNSQKFINDLNKLCDSGEEDNSLLDSLESEYENLLDTDLVNKISLDAEDLLIEVKKDFYPEVIEKYFMWSTNLFNAIDSFLTLNKKFISYSSMLKKIDDDVYSASANLLKIPAFSLCVKEYKRRMKFLGELKYRIKKLKNDIELENETRSKFLESLTEDKIIDFFSWGEIKDNFDIYGDMYYKSAKEIEVVPLEVHSENDKKAIEKYLDEIKKLKEKIAEKNEYIQSFEKDINDLSTKLDSRYSGVNNKEIVVSQMIKKTFMNHFLTLLDIKNTSIKNDYVTITSIEKGTKNIFIRDEDNQYYTSVLSKSDKTLVLNTETIKDELNNADPLVIIGTVEEIKKAKLSPSYEVRLSSLDYIITRQREPRLKISIQ